MDYTITPFTIEAYEKVYALWRECDGIGLSRADSMANIQRYLKRNPGMSFIAETGDEVVGALLAGHDGRRGYIHHLAVDRAHRRKGIARKLVEKSLDALGSEGILKCHLFVFRDNPEGHRFWNAIGWRLRSDLGVISIEIVASR